MEVKIPTINTTNNQQGVPQSRASERVTFLPSRRYVKDAGRIRAMLEAQGRAQD